MGRFIAPVMFMLALLVVGCGEGEQTLATPSTSTPGLSTAATSPVTAIEATRTPEPDEASVPGVLAPPDLVVASGDSEVTAG
ncbi:MAG: hypothetical protein WBD55_04190, partial [Dehalococcoidia bacterium]